MLKLKLQYFGHLVLRADSLKKIPKLGKIEGRRWRRQRMKWLEGITDSMEMCLSKPRKIPKDKEARRAAVHGVAKSRTQLSDWTRTFEVEVPLSTGGAVVITGSLHKVASVRFPCRPLVPQTNRALGNMGFLGCELEWNVPERSICSLVSHGFFPLKLHTPDPQTNPNRDHGTQLRVLRC